MNQVSRSGCAVVFETGDAMNKTESVAFSMEKTGPKGYKQKRNLLTAALRAAIAALEFKLWASEGWKQVTIATDNQKLYNGITREIVNWDAQIWLDEDTGALKIPYGNLWCRLLNLINEQAFHGCEVSFWRITAEQNQEAATMAQAAASLTTVPGLYRPCGDVGYTFKAALEAGE